MKLKLDYKKIATEVITASLIIIVSALAIISFIIISGQEVNIYKPNAKVDIIKGTTRVEEVLNILEGKYIGDIDVNGLIDGAVEGMFLKIDDPYTRYLTEEEYNEAVNSGKEEYTGIGVRLYRNNDTGILTVVSVMPNSPAKLADVQVGDLIIKVDDIDVAGGTNNNAADQIKGIPDTNVKLTIKRDDKIIEIIVKREKIIENNVESNMLEDNIAYIKILKFDNGVYDQFNAEYNELVTNKKAKGLIVDLRNNPGGFVSDTVKIADILVKEGVIVEEVFKNNNKKVYKSGANQITIPLVVLVNKNSASASEILAGAIKDLKQGTLIGEKTYGKGIVQAIIKLEGKGGISVTTAEYYTASGNKIHKKGIEPDIIVSLPIEYQNSEIIPFVKDTQLQKAINLILGK